MTVFLNRFHKSNWLKRRPAPLVAQKPYAEDDERRSQGHEHRQMQEGNHDGGDPLAAHGAGASELEKAVEFERADLAETRQEWHDQLHNDGAQLAADVARDSHLAHILGDLRKLLLGSLG